MANIAPLTLRREEALKRMWSKLKENKELPIHSDIRNPPYTRLKSRKSVWKIAEKIISDDKSLHPKWKNQWMNDLLTHG